MTLRRSSGYAALLACMAIAPASADIAVWFDAQDTVIPQPGETAQIELWADCTDPIVAWGLDVICPDPAVAGLSDVLIDVNWDSTTTLDGDGLAGLRLPPGLIGDVRLATLTFTGLEVGTTELSINCDDEDEGFLLELGGLDPSMTCSPGTITVLPEPATMSLLTLAGLALVRRRH